MDIHTEFAVGDAVYISTIDGVEKKVIQRIVVVNEDGKVKYGFERSAYLYYALLYRGDGYDWYNPSVLYSDKKAANANVKNLKAKKQEKDRRKQELEDQIEKLDEDE